MRKDDTFLALGILIFVGICAAVLLSGLFGGGLSTSDFVWALIALATLSGLCWLAHKTVNKDKDGGEK